MCRRLKGGGMENFMKIQKKWIAAFLTPATLLFVFVYALSILVLFVTSFSKWHIGQELQFIGLANYRELLHSAEFKIAVQNTLKWIFLQCTVHVLIGVTFAMTVSRRTRAGRFANAVFMIPNIISSAALGMLYLCILNSKFGLVNSVIRFFGNENYNQNWFMDPKTAFFSVTMTWLPFAATVAILVSTEMTSIDASLYEAASIDGATEFQKRIYVTLPLVKKAVAAGTILSATSMLQKLDLIFMTTNGGPGTATLNLPMLIYQTSMRDNNYSLSSAQGIVLILIGLLSIGVINWIYRVNKED